MLHIKFRFLRELLLLLLLAILWGGSYPLIKIAVQEVPPLTLVTTRVVIAAFFLSFLVAISGHSFPKERITWVRFLVQSFFNSVGTWTLLAWGQQYIDSSTASVLNSSAPIFVVVILFFLLKTLQLGQRKF